MKIHCLALWIIMVATPLHTQAQDIYKWTDANGNVHFSDKSHPGAEKIELPKPQTYSVPKTPNLVTETEPTTDSIASDYLKISIAQPEDQATIRNPQGYLSVILDIKPKLQVGDKVQIILDDSPFGEPQASTVFGLRDITRGSHTLVAQLIDYKGKIIKTSELVTFYMMPPRVGMVHKQSS